MNGLRLVLRAAPARRLDLSPLLPSRLAGLAAGAIERLALAPGVAVADVFAVHPGDAEAVTIEGGSARLDRVGAGLDGGTLRLEGEAGQSVAAGMSGGRLDVTGDVGPSAAAGLRGGLVEIGGDAGDGLAGPLDDERVGMEGGLVVVRGRAGAHAGDRLRRGLVVVEGDAGAFAGARMIAGTLVVCGRAGPHPGALMRRGTLVLGSGSALPGSSFVASTRPDPVFVHLLARHLQGGPCPSRPAVTLLGRGLGRCLGDMASLGKGELLGADLPP